MTTGHQPTEGGREFQHDPDRPGAYYDPPGDPPRASDLPLRLAITWRLTPPPEPPPGPDPAPVVTPEPGVCRDPNPAGCRVTGCKAGFRCAAEIGCTPSSCGCRPDTGLWVCTADCDGGMCVPDR